MKKYENFRQFSVRKKCEKSEEENKTEDSIDKKNLRLGERMSTSLKGEPLIL